MTNVKTHMAWAIAVLAALFIGSMAVEWATLEEVPTIISIALGLSSLVLAMVAIFQSMSAGSGLSQTLGKIDHAAERTTDASSALSAAASSLLTKAASIDRINPSLDALHERLSNAMSAASNVSNSTPQEKGIHGVDTKDVQDIYDLATTGFNVAMYIAKLSFIRNKSFRTEDIIPYEYFAGTIMGYLVSLRAAGIIEMEYINGTMLMKNMGPFTSEVVDERMAESVERDALESLKQTIDAYFAPTSSGTSVEP